MKISMNMIDRMVYLNIIHSFKHGNFARWKALKSTSELLALKPEEKEHFNIENDGQRLAFGNPEEAERMVKEYEIPDAVHFSVVEFLSQRNEQGNALFEHMQLAEHIAPQLMNIEDDNQTPST